MKKIFLPLLLALSFSSTQAAVDTNSLQRAITGKQRSAEQKVRDQYRHPQQTLTFFDVKDNMTVVEIWPGEGWYTEILAPYLKDRGKLYAAHFSADAKLPYFKRGLENFVKKLHKQPTVYGKVELTVLQPPDLLQIAPDGLRCFL